MTAYALPVLYALFLWWFSTGVILYLDGLPARTFRWSLLGATVLLVAALDGLALTSGTTDAASAYAAFTCGLTVWAWQEMAFLLGFVTGPSRSPCPAGCTGGERLRHAIRAILYHELAIAAGAAAVVALTWGQPNQIGTWTYLMLWSMRLSAKLNVFLGVRNLNEQFLPEHLRYLGSFFRRRPMNALFPVSAIVATLITIGLFQAALASEAQGFRAVGFTALGTLMALAVLEHWFMVLPIPAEALWSWGLRSRRPLNSKLFAALATAGTPHFIGPELAPALLPVHPRSHRRRTSESPLHCPCGPQERVEGT